MVPSHTVSDLPVNTVLPVYTYPPVQSQSRFSAFRLYMETTGVLVWQSSTGQWQPVMVNAPRHDDRVAGLDDLGGSEEPGKADV